VRCTWFFFFSLNLSALPCIPVYHILSIRRSALLSAVSSSVPTPFSSCFVQVCRILEEFRCDPSVHPAVIWKCACPDGDKAVPIKSTTGLALTVTADERFGSGNAPCDWHSLASCEALSKTTAYLERISVRHNLLTLQSTEIHRTTSVITF
jgi:hypothetical protein